MRPCCSLFSRLLKLFPRAEFQTLVRQPYAERHARGGPGARHPRRAAVGGRAPVGFVTPHPALRRHPPTILILRIEPGIVDA